MTKVDSADRKTTLQMEKQQDVQSLRPISADSLKSEGTLWQALQARTLIVRTDSARPRRSGNRVSAPIRPRRALMVVQRFERA